MINLDVRHLQYSRVEEESLIPAIIQDCNSGEVLSLFYMNPEALKKSLETEQVWRYSRTHRRVMMKGEESGNTMKIVSVSPDCEYKSLLVKVNPKGPACHTGEKSCFNKAEYL